METWPVIVNFLSAALVAVLLLASDAVASSPQNLPSRMAADAGRVTNPSSSAELTPGRAAFEVRGNADIRNGENANVAVPWPTRRGDTAVQVSSNGAVRFGEDAESFGSAQLDISDEKLIRRNHALPTVSPVEAQDVTLVELIGELFVISGEFDAEKRRFSKQRTHAARLVGLFFMALGSIIILVCAGAVAVHFNPDLLASESSARPAAPQRPSQQPATPTMPKEKAVECDVTGGIVAVVGAKETSLFNSSLFKLDEDCFDSAHEIDRWRDRDVWIGNQGVMYYYSKKDERPVALWDGRSVGNLIVQREPTDRGSYKFCVSVGPPPSDRPDEDPNPTLWGAVDEATISSFVEVFKHFQMVEQDRAEALFSCTLVKLENTSKLPGIASGPLEGRFVDENWKEYVVWINNQGVICYYSIKDKNIAAFCNGVGVGYLNVERLDEGLTCQQYGLAVSTMEPVSPTGAAASGGTDKKEKKTGGTMKKKKASPMILFGMPNERTLMGFVLVCEKVKEELIASSPSFANRRNLLKHGASAELLQLRTMGTAESLDSSAGYASNLADRKGVSQNFDEAAA